uniref:Uncharacterized protein n=1 Tax=Oryza glumipatula TaxID=40148 RepID=A0A0E0BJT7_9ORYZ
MPMRGEATSMARYGGRHTCPPADRLIASADRLLSSTVDSSPAACRPISDSRSRTPPDAVATLDAATIAPWKRKNHLIIADADCAQFQKLPRLGKK